MRVITLTCIYYAAAFYGLVNPRLGLLFLFHIIIFRPENLAWGSAAFGRLHLVTTLCVLAGYFVRIQKFRIHDTCNHSKNNLVMFFFLIAWLMTVSVFAEASVQSSLDQTWEVVKIFIFCFLFSKLIQTERELNRYVWVVVLSFGVLSFWGILQTMAGNTRLDDLWSAGSVGLSAQLALMTPVAVGKAFDSNLSLTKKVVSLSCAFSMALCAVASQSRGGFLGLCVGLVVFLLVSRYRVRLAAISGIALLLILPLISAAEYARVKSIFVPAEDRDVSADSRLVLWTIALRIWQDYPVAGVGLNNFSDVKEQYNGKMDDVVKTDEMNQLIFGVRRMPHGTYTGMLSETGIIGLALFLSLLFHNVFCRVSKRATISHNNLYMQLRGAQAGLLGFAVAALFGDLQYIEMFYVQMFFVGVVRDSLQLSATSSDCEPSTVVNSLRLLHVSCTSHR
jgi:probable O-glycosylation ligase (exosortase A-associated)